MHKLIVLLFISLFMFYSCSDNSTDPTKEENEAPVAPSENTMMIDFGDFEYTTAQGILKTADQQTMTNWLRAATTVFFWKTIAQFTLAVPTMALKMAIVVEPQYEDGTWIWSHDFNTGEGSFNATLKGFRDDTAQRWNWEMYISMEGSFQNFKWFYGFSSFDGSNGGWTINKSPEDTNPFLDVAWEIHEDSTRVVKWTNADTSSNGYGSYIEFGTMVDELYNAYFTILDKSEDPARVVEIQWNTTTKAGRIKDEAFYQDTNWHCWDENRQDVECPQ